ncbi:MAG: RHS repeat-associated core domain-containing protein, partial [Bacteroidales bacterium]|nr:RHS repeat-associated core domain-containing protein [Bacteroidales bacterium]
TTNRFKFNGKEEQTTGNLNYLDYGARMYDSNIGRWMVQDPLAEQMYMVTPYRFSLNNPVNFIDPDGLFETRREARQYRREYDTGGHVEKNEDGTYSINNKKTGYSYSKQTDADPNTIGLDENGVVKSIIVTPYTHNENPIIQSIYDGHQEFIEHPITQCVASFLIGLYFDGLIRAFNQNAIVPNIYTITGFTEHGVHNAITRGFRAGDVLKIVRNGDFTTKRGKFGKLNSVYTLNNNKVIINEKGKIITVFSNRQGSKYGIGKGFIK